MRILSSLSCYRKNKSVSLVFRRGKAFIIAKDPSKKRLNARQR